MKIATRFLCALCAAVMLAGCCLAAAAEEKTPARKLIEQFVIRYAAYGERDGEALAELSALDPALADEIPSSKGVL